MAEAVEHGSELRVPYDRDFVEGAPGMEPGGRLWSQEADLDEEEDAAEASVRGLPPR